MKFLSAWLRRAKSRIQFKREKKKEMNMPKEMGVEKEVDARASSRLGWSGYLTSKNSTQGGDR
jgi:hypothetical protein